MQISAIEDTNIKSNNNLISPYLLKKKFDVSPEVKKNISNWRKTISKILQGDDHRLMVVVGPCSIHDTEAGLDYARRLKKLSDELSDTLFIVMRVYFEKPRTTVGWKGLINDPHIDNSFQVESGLTTSRKLLLNIAEIGLPVATEALDPVSPQYYHDLISWTAIGARTTESQTHREMASGLSSPVGFKNGTDGSLSSSINAILSSSNPHRFLGINGDGQVSIIETKGNPDAHIVLRGGSTGPNFDSVSISICEVELEKKNLTPSIIIDCSHANSQKNHENQTLVADNIVSQILEGNQSIRGIMLESNINAGNQAIPENLDDLLYGVSITDKCIDWETTESSLTEMRVKLRYALLGRNLPELDESV